MSLATDQIEWIRRYGKDFKEWLKTFKAKKEINDHREHEKYLKQKLNLENLYKLNLDDFKEIFGSLWSPNAWPYIEWQITHGLIERATVPDLLKRELHNLLYGSSEISIRYDNFVKNVTGSAPTSLPSKGGILSEILSFVFPEKYCFWNNEVRNTLTFLMIGRLSEEYKLLESDHLNGSEYLKCINFLKEVKSVLNDYGVVDFIDLNIYFYYINNNTIPMYEFLQKLSTPEGIDEWLSKKPTFGEQKLSTQLSKAQFKYLCPGCGSEISRDDKFCRRCGKKFK